MVAARLARQRRRMIMYKKRMAKMHSTNIVSSKKFGGGSHRKKKHKDIAMIHDTDSCKRARLNRRMSHCSDLFLAVFSVLVLLHSQHRFRYHNSCRSLSPLKLRRLQPSSLGSGPAAAVVE
uniref:Uncharacterized protein n=1 Tax=Quercus lobata TaxID=97700 RepID=A0A7N2MUY5_QUELO